MTTPDANVEEICTKCGKAILENEGRYRFGGGANVQCSPCGDDANDLKTGIVL
jgi:hypothetical protein